MKRALLLLSLAVVPAGQVKAQEGATEPLDMQVEFIRRLRNKGYSDLAGANRQAQIECRR